jgi:hypothetical protein
MTMPTIQASRCPAKLKLYPSSTTPAMGPKIISAISPEKSRPECSV